MLLSKYTSLLTEFKEILQSTHIIKVHKKHIEDITFPFKDGSSKISSYYICPQEPVPTRVTTIISFYKKAKKIIEGIDQVDVDFTLNSIRSISFLDGFIQEGKTTYVNSSDAIKITEYDHLWRASNCSCQQATGDHRHDQNIIGVDHPELIPMLCYYGIVDGLANIRDKDNLGILIDRSWASIYSFDKLYGHGVYNVHQLRSLLIETLALFIDLDKADIFFMKFERMTEETLYPRKDYQDREMEYMIYKDNEELAEIRRQYYSLFKF